jgi:hypothetical protein
MSTAKDHDLRPEYSPEDLGAGVRGKYARRYQEQARVVVLDPDLAEVFPSSRDVNDALRELLEKREKGAAK